MDIQTVTLFFMWCTIFNGVILTSWIIILKLIPDLVYRAQNTWFPMPREKYNIIMYSFMGILKLLFFFFNFIPYVVLLIIG